MSFSTGTYAAFQQFLLPITVLCSLLSGHFQFATTQAEPFNGSTHFTFHISQASEVRMTMIQRC